MILITGGNRPTWYSVARRLLDERDVKHCAADVNELVYYGQNCC